MLVIEDELTEPFAMDEELLKPLDIGAAPLKPFAIDAELPKLFDMDVELALVEKEMGGGRPEYPFGGVVFGSIVTDCELISSPMSRRHASNPPTSIIGILFRSFVNACSLIKRTSIDMGEVDDPNVCED